MKAFVLNAISEFSFSKVENSETFFISFDALQNAEMMIINLNQRAFKHGLEIMSTEFLKKFHDSETFDPFAYVVSDRYISDEFYGIMIDTDASKYSIADYEQYLVYKAIYEINIDFIKAETIYVQFEIGSISSIKSIDIATLIDRVEFHIIKTNTSFLLCLADLDRLKIYFNNVQNILVSENKTFSMIRRFGHPFFLWDGPLQAYIIQSFNSNPCYLTETELRHLHRRFGHPSPKKLQSVLEKSKHEINKTMFDRFIKFCIFCQKHSRSSERFKFVLREKVNFNFSIIVDIMYIDNNSVLHVIDEGTKFQAVKWLKEISAKHI